MFIVAIYPNLERIVKPQKERLEIIVDENFMRGFNTVLQIKEFNPQEHVPMKFLGLRQFYLVHTNGFVAQYLLEKFTEIKNIIPFDNSLSKVLIAKDMVQLAV